MCRAQQSSIFDRVSGDAADFLDEQMQLRCALQRFFRTVKKLELSPMRV